MVCARRQGTPDKSLWQGVVAALHLTPRQQQQARELQAR